MLPTVPEDTSFLDMLKVGGVLQTGSGDEGTAMLEIIHDLAPDARLYFATAEIASAIAGALEIAASGGAGDGLKMITPIHYGAGESLACLQGRQQEIRH